VKIGFVLTRFRKMPVSRFYGLSVNLIFEDECFEEVGKL